MSSEKNNLTILISAEDADEQFIFRTAVTEVDPNAILLIFDTAYELKRYLQFEIQKKEIIDFKFHILIVDLNPPFFDLEDIGEIREMAGCDTLPFHVFAESYAGFEAEQVRNAGAVSFSHKPSSLNELKKFFQKILKSPIAFPEKPLGISAN